MVSSGDTDRRLLLQFHPPSMPAFRLPACALVGALAASLSPLEAQLSSDDFLNPPLQARPSALWTWMNAHVDQAQLTHELKEMKAKGMRGAVIWDMGALIDPEGIIPQGPPFLGPKSVASIHHVIDEADRLGLEMGLSAASSWNAGGPWIKAADGSQTVAWTSKEVVGPKAISLAMTPPKQAKAPTTTLAVIAVPGESAVIRPDQTVRLEGQLDAEGQLNWAVPDGKWTILHFVSTATGQHLMCPSPQSRGLMVDHLSVRATRHHLDHVMQAITREREDLGALRTLFLDSYEVKTPMDWTPDFISAFEQAYGYDPLPWLPVLAGITVASEDLSARFRHDYGRLVSDLVIENHFALAREMANDQGLQLLAEAGHGGYAKFDTLKALGAVDVPMGEYWNHRKNWCVKEAASAANLYGKTLVNAEAMTGWQHWQDGPRMYKRLTDIAFCAGLNQITFHTFAHQPPGSGLPGFAYHAGEHLNVNLTWWPQARPLMDSLSRSCHLLQQGRFVADVCAYYGDGAPNLVPARRLAPTVKPRWTADKCLHCGRDHPVDLSSLGQGHDYDYLNEEILVERMQTRDGRLVLANGMEYRLLALPDRPSISLVALEKIEQLVREGATVVGPKPGRSNSMSNYPDCDAKVRALADRIWGTNTAGTSHRYGMGQVIWDTPLDEVLTTMGVAPDFIAEGIDNRGRQIDFIHRRADHEDIYFICNTTEAPLNFTATFRVGDQRAPRIWNPEDGTSSACLHYTSTAEATHIPLTLAPASSRFVVFSGHPSALIGEHLIALHRSDSDGQEPVFDSEIIALQAKQVQLRVQQAGTYTAATSRGRTGSATISSIPSEHPLTGPWKLEFETERGAPAAISLETLSDWSQHPDPGIRFFSGTGTYHKALVVDEATQAGIEAGQRLHLQLGEVRETAVISINGKQIATLWKPPYEVDVTPHLQPGENQFSIAVTNVWNNRLVGDAGKDTHSGVTRTNLRGKFKAGSPLRPSGLLGPVRLETRVPLTIPLKGSGQ